MTEIIAVAVTVACAALALATLVGRHLKHIRETTTVPACFGNMPSNPQHRAEFDCPNCEYRGSCFYARPPSDVQRP